MPVAETAASSAATVEAPGATHGRGRVVVRGGGGEPIASGAVRTRRLGILSGGLVLAALGVATTGCADQSVAARVGDETITDAELQDELEALAPVVQGQIEGQLRDSYRQEYVGNVLQSRIIALLLDQTLAGEGVEVNEDARAQIRQELEQNPAFADLPEWYQDQVVEDEALFAAMDQLSEDESVAVQTAFFALAEDTEIENPRYGSWDPDRLDAALARQGLAVLPPDGPQRPEGGESQAGAGPAVE